VSKRSWSWGQGVIADFEICDGTELQVACQIVSNSDGKRWPVYDIRIWDAYDKREKTIVGQNIESLEEALDRAQAWLYAFGHTGTFR